MNDKEKNQNFGNGMDDFIEYDEKYEEKANNSDWCILFYFIFYHYVTN